MHASNSSLVRHLAIAIALKMIALGLIWWHFVRNEQMLVDHQATAGHLVGEAAPAGQDRQAPETGARP